MFPLLMENISQNWYNEEGMRKKVKKMNVEQLAQEIKYIIMRNYNTEFLQKLLAHALALEKYHKK